MLPGLTIDKIIALTGLNSAADKQLGDYSSGMKQRVKLAQALVHDPRLLLLDEHLLLLADLFDAHLCEVEHDDKRLIVRRNETVRVREGRRREDKLAQLQAKVAERNAFVKNSRRASAARASG